MQDDKNTGNAEILSLSDKKGKTRLRQLLKEKNTVFFNGYARKIYCCDSEGAGILFARLGEQVKGEELNKVKRFFTNNARIYEKEIPLSEITEFVEKAGFEPRDAVCAIEEEHILHIGELPF